MNTLNNKTVSILRRKQVQDRTGLSRSTIYLRIAEGTFPKPVSLGARSVGWIDAEVDAWLANRIDQSRPQSASKASIQKTPSNARKRKFRKTENSAERERALSPSEQDLLADLSGKSALIGAAMPLKAGQHQWTGGAA